MSKEKSKKSDPITVLFPEGARKLYFGLTEENDNEWLLGRINLISREKEGLYTGAITFGDKVAEIVANDPFPLHVTFTPDGTIHFHVEYATRDFNQDGTLKEEFHFMFEGKCEWDEHGKALLFGNGGVPAAFCPASPQADDGENVIWT